MSADMDNREKALLGAIGLCRGAGRAVIGVPMICETMQKRSGKSDRSSESDENTEFLVIEASDTSENTHKRISDRCAYYKVRHIQIESTCLALGRAVGKGAVAAVAINDKSFCRLVLSKLSD